MNMPTRRLLEALEHHGCRPRPSGRGWKAHCPAHHDRRPSLSINDGDNGGCVIKCHAGCDSRDVLAALGMTLADLQPDVGVPDWCDHPLVRKAAKVFDAIPLDPIFPTADVAISRLSRSFGRLPDQSWTYTNIDGDPVGYVLRWNKATGKEIRPVSRYPEGWRIGAMPPPRPLYKLPQILSTTGLVFVAEGEPAVDVLWECGLASTTSAGGACAARFTDWSPLRGRHVCILPDNDVAGRRYAEAVARLCLKIGAASVKILDLACVVPKLGEGGDVVDIYRAPDWLGVPLGERAEPTDLGHFLRREAERLDPWRPSSTGSIPSPPITNTPIHSPAQKTQEHFPHLSTLPWVIREAWKKAIAHRKRKLRGSDHV